MFTIYFIFGFVLFCIILLVAVDFATFLDYQRDIRTRNEEIKDLMNAHKLMTDRKEANRTMGRITRLQREVDKLTREMVQFSTFNQRWSRGF